MHHFNFCFTTQKSQGSKAYKLKESKPCYAYASDSTILSLAVFIINHFPKLKPPTVSQEIYDNIKFDQAFVDCSNVYHPLQNPWCSYIVDLVIGNHAVYYEGTMFVEVPVQEIPSHENLTALFQAMEINKQIQDNHERCRFLFNLPEIKRNGNKIGIVSYRPRSNNILEPHLNTPALFIGNLYNNEQWKIFKIGNNELPSLQELLTYRCIILPGSTYNISDNAPNVIKVALARILQAYKLSKELKLIGVCFGHQLLAQSFGAKIEKLKRVDGTETIYFDLELAKKYPFLNGIADIPKLYLSQYHGDYVTTMPKEFILLARSKSCEFQSFISTNGRIFTTQFHSEYFRRFMKRLQNIFRTYYGNVSLNKIEDPQIQDLETSNHHHARLMLQCLRKFIDQ